MINSSLVGIALLVPASNTAYSSKESRMEASTLLEDNVRQPCLHRSENQFSHIVKEMMRVGETPCLWVCTYRGAIHRASSKNSLKLPETTNQHKI